MCFDTSVPSYNTNFVFSIQAKTLHNYNAFSGITVANFFTLSIEILNRSEVTRWTSQLGPYFGSCANARDPIAHVGSGSVVATTWWAFYGTRSAGFSKRGMVDSGVGDVFLELKSWEIYEKSARVWKTRIFWTWRLQSSVRFCKRRKNPSFYTDSVERLKNLNTGKAQTKGN